MIYILLILALGMSIPGEIAFGSDFHSPRTDALGGAGHASPLLTDATYLNPSFASYLNTHGLTLNYFFFSGNTINTPLGPSDYYGNLINASVIDGTTESLFQAGVGYTRREDSTMIHIGASKSVIQRLGIGIGTKLIFPRMSGFNRIIDGSVSVTGMVANWFQVAGIVDNVLETGANRGFYREFVIGTKFNVDGIVLIYVDPHFAPGVLPTDAKFGFETGVEFPFFNDLFLRLGMFRGSNIPFAANRGDGYGAGVGWLAPKLSLDYGLSRVVSPNPAVSHNFGMTVYF